MSFNYKSNFNMVKSLNELRLTNTGCDVVIQVGQRSFMAHRVVLMARLEYFRNMLTIDMREKKELVIPLDPTIIDPDFFEDLLECIYTSKLQFTATNLKPICEAADYFCFDEVLQNAENYLKASIETGASEISFKDILSGVGTEALQKECNLLLLMNPSSEIARKLLIPLLSYSNLKVLLKKLNDLSKQEDMFHYCVEWITSDISNRKDKLPELMKNISLDHFSRSFLKEVVCKNSLFSKDSECLQLIIKALTLEKPREIVYAIGGTNTMPLSSVSRFDLITNQWESSAQMLTPLLLFSCSAVGQKFYVCGGQNRGAILNKLCVFDCNLNRWKTLKSMRFSRVSCSMAEYNGYLYVAGGRNGNQTYDKVERYSIEKNEWQDMSPMHHKRIGLELLQMKGYLYAIGGFQNTHLNSAERFNLQTGEWQPIANMNYAYAWFGAVVFQDTIFIVGRNTFEKYDSRENRWIVLPAPSVCDLGRRLAVLNGKLYVFGGDCQIVNLKSVEYFDFVQQAWFTTKDMDVARAYHGVVVIKNL